MPDVNALANLYPQPSNPSQVGLAGMNPLQVYGLVNEAATIQARQGQANALAGAIGSDGSFDPNAYATAIKANPSAAYGLDPASLQQQQANLLGLRGQQIANDTGAFKLAVGQSSTLQDAVGAMANDPSLTPDKVISTITGIARRTNVPSSMLTSVIGSMPASGSPAQLRNWAAGLGTISMGSAAASDRVPGAPDPLTGAPTNTSRGAANYAGQYPAALPPGQSDALAAGQNAFVADQQKATQTMASLRPLEQAIPLIEQLNHFSFGPGSPELAKIKAGLATIGFIDPNTSDVTLRQVANKQLNVFASQARGAGRSDEGLAQAKASTPNLDLTQPANLELIKNQLSLDRMTAAMPTAFQMENGTGMNARAQYPGYGASYYSRMDPRAFRFDTMQPQERTDLLSSLGVKFNAQGQPSMPAKPSPALQKLLHSYAIARQAMNYAGQGANGQ